MDHNKKQVKDSHIKGLQSMDHNKKKVGNERPQYIVSIYMYKIVIKGPRSNLFYYSFTPFL